VTESKESTFYHQIGWKNVVKNTYGHKPIYLIARDKDRIVGILPLFLIRNPFLKSSLVSLPFSQYGGICADNPQIGLDLFDGLINLCRETGQALIGLDVGAPLNGGCDGKRHGARRYGRYGRGGCGDRTRGRTGCQQKNTNDRGVFHSIHQISAF